MRNRLDEPLAARGASPACPHDEKHPTPATPLAKFGSAVTSGVLACRGGVGRAGKMPNRRHSQTFAELDRRVYSLICLIIAALSLAGTVD